MWYVFKSMTKHALVLRTKLILFQVEYLLAFLWLPSFFRLFLAS